MTIARRHQLVTAPLWRRFTMGFLALLLMLAIAPASALADPHTPELDRTDEETGSLSLDVDRTGGGDTDSETGSLSLDVDRTGGSAIDPELAALGITGPTSYTSPQFGYRVEWSDSWELNISDGLDIAITSDETTTPPRDSLALSSANEDATLQITGSAIDGYWFDPDGDIPQQFVEQYEAYADSELLENASIDAVDLLLVDHDGDFGSAVYLITWENGDQFLFQNQIQVIDDIVVTTLLSTTPGPAFLSAYIAAIDEITVAGDSAFPFLDKVEVEQAVRDFLDEFESGGDNGSAATAAYLEDVRDYVDELQASYDLFIDILSTEGALSEADADALNDILILWKDAPGVAEALDPPAALDDLHAVYLDYTDALADMGDAFIAFIRSEPDSAAEDDAIAAFQSARVEVEDLGQELTDLLDHAGA